MEPHENGWDVEHRDESRATHGESAVDVPLRGVMACFPTGVTVVAACDELGNPRGLTVNSFTSVSLDPPLVLVCIGHETASLEHLVKAEGFAVSILAADQRDVAERFSRPPSEGRFDEVDWTTAPSGHPVLSGAAAWLDCAVDEVVDAGDHAILLGRALASALMSETALVRHMGTWTSIGG